MSRSSRILGALIAWAMVIVGWFWLSNYYERQGYQRAKGEQVKASRNGICLDADGLELPDTGGASGPTRLPPAVAPQPPSLR